MGLFDFFKSKNSAKENVFKMHILGDHLVYMDHMEREKINLAYLKYIYAHRLGDEFYLVLFDYKVRYIPASQLGFMDCFKKLRERFSLDFELFQNVFKASSERKERLWLASRSQNYAIDNAIAESICLGITVLKEPTVLIPWETTYEELLTLDVGYLYTNEQGLRYFKFAYLSRIAGITIKDLEVYYENGRQDVPIQGFFCDLYHAQNNDESYFELKGFLLKHADFYEEYGYERDDQNYLLFHSNGIEVSLIYSYGVGNNYDMGATSLFIKNKRDYRDLVIKDLDEKSNSLHCILFPEHLHFIPQYTDHAHIVLSPANLPDNEHAMFWYDEDNRRFGFTGDIYSIVYQKENVECIIIQNVLPAKGGGYSELMVKPNNGYSESIYYAGLNELNEVGEQIARLSGVEVIFPEPYYNC